MRLTVFLFEVSSKSVIDVTTTIRGSFNKFSFKSKVFNDILNWFSANDLNADKIHYMRFHTPKSNLDEINIKCKDQPIQKVEDRTLLDAYIDSKCYRSTHILQDSAQQHLHYGLLLQ